MFHSVWCFTGWVPLLARVYTVLFYMASLGDLAQTSVTLPVIDADPMGAPGKGLGKLPIDLWQTIVVTYWTPVVKNQKQTGLSSELANEIAGYMPTTPPGSESGLSHRRSALQRLSPVRWRRSLGQGGTPLFPFVTDQTHANFCQ